VDLPEAGGPLTMIAFLFGMGVPITLTSELIYVNRLTIFKFDNLSILDILSKKKHCGRVKFQKILFWDYD
jgi:hypothetical protein